MRHSKKTVLKNTTNGWGFNGYVLTQYVYPNGKIRMQKEHFFRHAPSVKENSYYDSNGNEIKQSEFYPIGG